MHEGDVLAVGGERGRVLGAGKVRETAELRSRVPGGLRRATQTSQGEVRGGGACERAEAEQKDGHEPEPPAA